MKNLIIAAVELMVAHWIFFAWVVMLIFAQISNVSVWARKVSMVALLPSIIVAIITGFFYIFFVGPDFEVTANKLVVITTLFSIMFLSGVRIKTRKKKNRDSLTFR